MGRKIKKVQTAFTSGQLSPDMAGRIDTRHWYAGASRILNLLLKPTGGATRRAGLTMVEELTDITADNGIEGVFIGEHRFNRDQTYLILGTHNKVRVYHQSEKVWEDEAAPWTGQQANEVQRLGALDTVLLFHSDIQPHSLLRNGAHNDWTLSAKELKNIPEHNFEDADSPTDANNDPIEENMWSDTRGWPSCGTFHGDRLVLGGSTQLPGKWAASVVSDYFNYDEGDAKDDLAVVAQANADEGDPIVAMYSQKHLLTFTSGSEFATLDYPMTPKKASSIRQSKIGASAISPVSIERGVLFVSGQRENERQTLIEFLYAGEAERAYEPQDLSLLAGDIIRAPVQDLALRRGNEDDRAAHVFVVNADGSVAVLNTLRSQDVTGWSEVLSPGGSGEDKILRVAVVGATVFFVTKRIIGGQTKYFLEKMEYGTWLDCSKVTPEDTAKKTFSGFDHLAGETVRVWANDGDRGNYPVDQNGNITLEHSATWIEAGYPSDWEITPMPFAIDLPDGTSFGDIQRVIVTNVQVKDTAEFYVDGKLQQFRKFGDELLDQKLPLYSGTKPVRHLGFDRTGTKRIHGSAPGPVTILSIRREVSV